MENLQGKNFNESISEGVHLVDFWAEWCGPCRMLTPVISELKEKYDGKAGVHKVNVDESSDLAKEFAIRSIPTVIIFKDGKEVERTAGVKEITFFEEKINTFLN
jgi:thioredoxin 1